jgi:hypothetical protein
MANPKVKGSNLERKIVTEINELNLGYKVGTSRLYSRYMDNMDVDIVDTPESNKRFPYHIQCKSYTSPVKYRDIFSEFKLKDRPLIIIHEVTEKRGSRFFKCGDYVIMKKEDFYEILKNIKND